MRVFRIQKSKYGTDITGTGSNLVEGRWHINCGTLRILYTAENQSLALLEKIESFTTLPGIALLPFTMLEIEIPDDKVQRVDITQLPAGWDSAVRNPSSQGFGMNWLQRNHSLGLSVPSVFSLDRNILINPQHPDFNQVNVVNVINNYRIDSRLTRTP